MFVHKSNRNTNNLNQSIKNTLNRRSKCNAININMNISQSIKTREYKCSQKEMGIQTEERHNVTDSPSVALHSTQVWRWEREREILAVEAFSWRRPVRLARPEHRQPRGRRSSLKLIAWRVYLSREIGYLEEGQRLPRLGLERLPPLK